MKHSSKIIIIAFTDSVKFSNMLTRPKIRDIMIMLHKLNIRISGIYAFIGGIIPFFAIIIF